MADAESLPERKRDRLRRHARRYMAVPLAVRTSDLPRRLASAVIMLAAAGTALYFGGRVLDALIVLVTLVTYGEFARLVWKATGNASYRVAGWLAGAIYIGLAGLLLVLMPALYFALVLIAVIMTDSGAYFVGRAIGGPKIAPRISPSKTWAGLLGGMAAAALWLMAVAFFIGSAASAMATSPDAGFDSAILPLAAAIGGAIAIAAQTGDFLESWLKRKAGVKDSSRLIPGHGGLFDRVDGLIPVAIVTGLIGVIALW